MEIGHKLSIYHVGMQPAIGTDIKKIRLIIFHGIPIHNVGMSWLFSASLSLISVNYHDFLSKIMEWLPIAISPVLKEFFSSLL